MNRDPPAGHAKGLVPIVADPDERALGRARRPPAVEYVFDGRAVPWSSEAVGSSSRSTAGSSWIARSSATIWASPPERSRLDLSRNAASRPRAVQKFDRSLSIKRASSVGLECERVAGGCPPRFPRAGRAAGGGRSPACGMPAPLRPGHGGLASGSPRHRAGRASPGHAIARSSPRRRAEDAQSVARIDREVHVADQPACRIRVAPADPDDLDGRLIGRYGDARSCGFQRKDRRKRIGAETSRPTAPNSRSRQEPVTPLPLPCALLFAGVGLPLLLSGPATLV